MKDYSETIEAIERKVRSVCGFFRSIATGFKNIVTWLPVIWNDRQFDQGYLFDILRFKMRLMEDFWKSDDTNVMHPEKTELQIRIARILLDRICEHSYAANAIMLLEEKYGHYTFEFEPSEGNPKFYRIVDKRSKKEQEEYTRAYKRSEYCENQDIEYLFDHMKKHIRKWWD